MALPAYPSDVPADLVPAARLPRLLAFVIDIGLIAAVVALLGATRRTVAVFLLSLPEGSPLTDPITNALTTIEGLQVYGWSLVFLLYAVYAVLAWGCTGTSLGKWLLGLRLARPTGQRPSFLRGIIRFVVMAALAPVLFLPWWSAWVRADRVGLHDFISGTRVVRMSESGIRRLTRGTMRRAISDLRWAAAIVMILLLAGGIAVAAVRFAAPGGATSGEATVARPVDEITQEAVKGAILEYDRMEEHATFRLDASILEPRSTQSWLARKSEEFAELRRRGLRQESRLLDASFKGFRWVGDNRIEADVVETWVSVLGDSTGRVLQERPAHDVPQTATVVRERGRWRVADVRHYEPGTEPF